LLLRAAWHSGARGAYSNPPRASAFDDGRFLESPVKLPDQGKGMTWSFVLGAIRTNSVLRINENGEWTELAEITIGSEPPKNLLELTVRPQN
jgi:hypothetical protein